MRGFRSFLFAAAAVLTAAILAADNASDEHRAVQKLELMGATITRDETLPARPVTGIDFQGSEKFNDHYLHLLDGFPRLKTLNFAGCRDITDAGLKEWKAPADLTELSLAGTQITDEGLKGLRDHKNLMFVDIRRTKCTAAGFAALRDSLPRLSSLDESTAIQKLELLGDHVHKDETPPGHPAIHVDFGPWRPRGIEGNR